MKELRKRKLYVLMDVLCVVVAALPFIIMTIVSKPYIRGVYCDDESIMYPVKPDTITHGMLAAVTITCTVIIISSGEAYLVYSKRIYSNSDFNQYVAALYKVVGTFLFGACVSQSLTDLAKFTIGRPRPNFMAVCGPRACTGYMQMINCTGKRQDVTEARLSFYSGHSSFGMYCMLFLAVRFVSDFFKKRPPRCTRPDTADSEEPERKPSLQIADTEHSNHYNYHHNPGPV
ncbi:hypothetical protein ABVT39_008130 [Epinephelus coioides]